MTQAATSTLEFGGLGNIQFDKPLFKVRDIPFFQGQADDISRCVSRIGSQVGGASTLIFWSFYRLDVLPFELYAALLLNKSGQWASLFFKKFTCPLGFPMVYFIPLPSIISTQRKLHKFTSSLFSLWSSAIFHRKNNKTILQSHFKTCTHNLNLESDTSFIMLKRKRKKTLHIIVLSLVLVSGQLIAIKHLNVRSFW